MERGQQQPVRRLHQQRAAALSANPASYPGRTRESNSRGFSVGVNSVITTSKVNEFNLGYTRNSILFLDPTHPKFEIVSNIQSDPYLFWGGTGRVPKNWQALDNFSFIHANIPSKPAPTSAGIPSISSGGHEFLSAPDLQLDQCSGLSKDGYFVADAQPGGNQHE